MADGVAQLQKTVSDFKKRYFDKVDLFASDGSPLGQEVFNLSPRSYLLIGCLTQFQTPNGVHREQYGSFELFRRPLNQPEIITFDELFERAKAIVEHAERQ